jgi:hypothetical protein
VDQRLRELLSDTAGKIRPELQALHHNLANHERPMTVLGWLGKSNAPAILRELGTGTRPLTHAALDELPESKPIEHLRAILVATGALPARDQHLARLERWVTATITGRPAGEQHLLRSYAVWHLMRRLRRCLGGTESTHHQVVNVRQHVMAATTVLDWLTTSGLTLVACRQADLEAWLAVGQATHHSQAGSFIRWARSQDLTSLEFPATAGTGPLASSTPRPHGNRPAGCCTTARSSPRTASPSCSYCSMPNGPPRSA